MPTKKHNLTWYNNRITELEAKLREAQTAEEGMAGSEHTCEEWNAASDLIFDSEEAIRSMQRDRDTRNWTGADWSSYDLVASNID